MASALPTTDDALRGSVSQRYQYDTQPERARTAHVDPTTSIRHPRRQAEAAVKSRQEWDSLGRNTSSPVGRSCACVSSDLRVMMYQRRGFAPLAPVRLYTVGGPSARPLHGDGRCM